MAVSKRILVVDDEEVVRSLCSRLLRPFGYHIETASNACEALEWCSRESFDLVVTDFRMPGELNGLGLSQEIKVLFPSTQVILMTAFPAVNTAVEMMRIGARDYLIKPFAPVDLIECVHSCFAKS